MRGIENKQIIRRKSMVHFSVNGFLACGNKLHGDAKTTEELEKVNCSNCKRSIDYKNAIVK